MVVIFTIAASTDLIFDFSNGVGLLGLDNGGTRTADTWYYLYAVPNGGNFSIVASTRSPIEATPGPNGYAAYKYIGAFMTDSSSNIQKFVHNYPNEFLFETRSEDYFHNYGAGFSNFTGMQTLTRAPETSTAVDVLLKMRLDAAIDTYLRVGTCSLWSDEMQTTKQNSCRVGIENYSKVYYVSAARKPI